jgi:hypothetical protein
MKATKEKELTLKIPLEELKEVREIWYDVCAFNQALEGINDGGDASFALCRLHKPIKERLAELMMGEPSWDSRILDVELPLERGAE